MCVIILYKKIARQKNRNEKEKAKRTRTRNSQRLLHAGDPLHAEPEASEPIHAAVAPRASTGTSARVVKIP